MTKALRRYADGRIATTVDGAPIRYDAGGAAHAADRSALVESIAWQIAKDEGLSPTDAGARRRAEEIASRG